MLFVLLSLAEITLLFYLSQHLTRYLSEFFLKITKSKSVTIQLLSFLFLPGVIVHELGHLLTAGILSVRVGEIEFIPKIIKRDGKNESVKLGGVAIAKTDPLRRLLIGAAPVLLGLSLLLTIVYFLTTDSSLINIFQTTRIIRIAIKAVLFYLLFAVANTMFSSRKDMEGAIEFLLAASIIIALLYFLGLKIPFAFLSNLLTKENLVLFKQVNLFLVFPLVIDGGVYFLLRILSKIFNRY